MYYYLIAAYLLISCSIEPHKEGHDEVVSDNSGETLGSSDLELSLAKDSSEQALEFFNPLLNSGFSNCFPKQNVVSVDYSEGLAIYTIKKPTVLSPGKGLVKSVSEGRIHARYKYVENGHICTYTLSIHHIASSLHEGDTIFTGDTLGMAKPEGDHYQIAVDSWIKASGMSEKWPLTTLSTQKGFMQPNELKNLIIIDKTHYHFWYYVNGKLAHDFPIALGQDPEGHKVEQGDNKTPEGLYTIVEKMKGPFSSPTGPWLGNSWFRLNYPNKWDAEKGFKGGLITMTQKDAITRAFNANRDTPNNTKLGGHIGIHGWNGDWYDYSTHDVTWGCVSMRNHQIDEIYDEIPVGTKVFILP